VPGDCGNICSTSNLGGNRFTTHFGEGLRIDESSEGRERKEGRKPHGRIWILG